MMVAGVGVVFGQQRNPGPGVVALPVAAGTGGLFLPGPFGQHGRELIDADRSGRGGDAPVGRHGQHVAQSVAAEGGPQRRVSTVDLIGGHPRRGDLRLNGAGDQRSRQGGFGRETPSVDRDSGVVAAIGIFGPRLGQVHSTVDEGVSAWGGVGQIHRDLGVLDTPRGAGVLALHPDRMQPLLHIPCLIEDQYRAGVAEGVDDVVAQIVTNPVGVPFRPRQQMLQPVGGGVAAVLSDRPAILAVQARDHPCHQLGGMPQGFVAAESRRDPIDHRRELRPPPIRVYAMSRGDRGIFRCIHKLRTMPRSPSLPAQTRHNATITNYGCSISP